MLKRNAVIGLLAFIAALSSTPARATEVLDRRDGQPGTFPVIAAESLRGRSVKMPEQFKGARNLVLVAYQREQQADVDTWLAVIDSVTAGATDFAYYEIPTISSSAKWMRAMIDGGMKQGIPDRAQRDRTITLYLDVDWFRGQIGTAGNDGIAALLVDRAGNISARWYGRYTAEAGAQLRAALADTAR